MAEVIPLFPLSHVLMPGMPLPLHIFEQRYRDLLDDVETGSRAGSDTGSDIGPARRSPSFGVVALRSGTEAATSFTRSPGPDGPAVNEVGTLAEILEIERSADGTSDVLAVGSRRFRVLALVTVGKAYLQAEVEFLDERDGDLTRELDVRARELMDVYDSMLLRIAGRGTGTELPDDAGQLSYQLAARLPLPPEEKQALLNDDTSAARLLRIAALLRREIALLQRTRSIAVSPAVLRMSSGSN